MRGGWIHIESRHITGTHPSTKPADIFKPNTTRAEIEKLADKVIKQGTRVSENPRQVMQTFELKTKFQGRRDRIKVTVHTPTERIITVYPVRSE